MKKIIMFVLAVFITVSAASAQEKIETKIDTVKEPWLVESARIPAGLDYQKKPRQLWANSFAGMTIQEILKGPIEAERWVNEPPKDITGKFVLVEVWATWCPPCRRSLALLEYFHKKYADKLIVVSICETDEEALKKMEVPTKLADIKAPLAVDTHRRFANSLGVYGIPHAVLIEPIYGAIVWEGMPTQIGYELSDTIIGKILANLDNPVIKNKLPPKAPFEFNMCPPAPNKVNEKPKAPIRSAGEE